MSAGIAVLAALFLAVPISVKYVTSFQIRTLMDALRRREREIELIYARLDALDLQREVVERAIGQVHEQRRWSATRRNLIAEELERVRRRAPVIRPRFEPEAPPVWEPELEPSAAAAQAAP